MFFRRKKSAPPNAPRSASAGSSDALEPARAGAPGRLAADPSGKLRGGALGAESDDAVAGPASTQFLTGDSSADRRTVQVLLEAIAAVSDGSRDLEALLVDIVDRSIEVTKAERGLLLLRGADDEGGLDVRVARSRGGKPLEGDKRFSTTIAGKVLDEAQAVRATVQSESEALDLGRSVYDLKLRAVMAVPLSVPGAPAVGRQASGVLYVDSRAATRQFSQRDLSLFAALGQHISIALENARLHLDSLEKVRLEQSLELASVIQHDLMPDVPTVAGYDLHGWYRPAERTGGDFYDFSKARDGRLAIAVGDVTGHGIGPALITASAQASMRSYLRFLSKPGEIMTMLNQDLCERIQDGRFVTMWLGLLAPEGTLEQLNAGHAQVLLWRKAEGAVHTFTKNGPALGMIDDETYEGSEPIQLEQGDVLVVYTDGLTEARSPSNPESFLGEQGLSEALAAAAADGLSAGEITERLVQLVLELCEEVREDDMTLVIVRRT